MQYTFPIELAANTSASAPTRFDTKLDPGTLTKVLVYFPWGCAGLVGLRILYYEHQVYPSNAQQWFTGNEILIEFEDDFLIEEGWGEFKVEGYNTDDFYTHTPIVSFVVLPIGGPFVPPETWLEG